MPCTVALFAVIVALGFAAVAEMCGGFDGVLLVWLNRRFKRRARRDRRRLLPSSQLTALSQWRTACWTLLLSRSSSRTASRSTARPATSETRSWYAAPRTEETRVGTRGVSTVKTREGT